MGALFDFFLVSGHLARRAVELLSFLGIFVSLVLFSSLLPFAPSLTEGEVGLLWIGVREGRKAVRVPRVATLVLLDRRPLQFPPFFRRRGAWEACSLFEPPLVSR